MPENIIVSAPPQRRNLEPVTGPWAFAGIWYPPYARLFDRRTEGRRAWESRMQLARLSVEQRAKLLREEDF